LFGARTSSVRGSVITSDGGLLAYRELDGAVRLAEMGAEVLCRTRTGKNGRHLLVGLLRQSVLGRLAGYEDVNDALILASCMLRRASALSGITASSGRELLRTFSRRLYNRVRGRNQSACSRHSPRIHIDRRQLLSAR
jgi:hypothetical protein